MRYVLTAIATLMLAAALAGCGAPDTSDDENTTTETASEVGDVYDQAAELFSANSATAQVEVWRPTWLPGGFELRDSSLQSHMLIVTYARDEDVITIRQGIGDYGDTGAETTASAEWGDRTAVMVLDDLYYDAQPGEDVTCTTVRGPSGPLQVVGITPDEALRIAASMERVH